MKYVNKTTGAIMESNCSCFGSDWKLVDDVDTSEETNEELDTSEETESEDAEEFEKNKDPKKEIQNE